MKPTHAVKAFAAQRHFTDRDEERAAFIRALTTQQGAEEYRVISWYGIGGQGKSALSRELVRICDRQKPKVAVARVDLDDMRMRRIDECLLSVRLQLSRTFGHRFGAFDTAFARYFVLTNPGLRIRERHPELFRGENPLLEDLIDWSEAGVELAAAGASLVVPGLNVIYKYGSRVAARTREWFDRKGKAVLSGLDQLSPDELLKNLPSYLGSDLCDLRKDKPDTRSVIIMDTHEALWRDHNVKDTVEGARVDDWLRLLVQDSPGTLFAVLGRDQLQWHRIDRDWQDIVESHLLGGLSDADADRFLQTVPIGLKTIRSAIISGAQGLPFFLDLQVDLYERVAAAEEYPDPALFGGSRPEILIRFLDHISGDEQRLLRIASYPQKLTEPLLNDLAGHFLGGIGHLNWRQLLRFSFITQDETGAIMHALMREALQQRERAERPDTFSRVHEWLFERFGKQVKAAHPSQIRSAHEAAFREAVHHGTVAQSESLASWFYEAINPFHTANRSRFLEYIYRQILPFLEEDLGSEHPATLDTRQEIARQILDQGRHSEAEAELRTIWELQRKPTVLGEEHPDTLITRRQIAQANALRGHYSEAEAELRAIWEIQRRPDVLGEEHTATLATRGALASIKARNQVVSRAEAEAELRAIWEIQRRPDVLGEENLTALGFRLLMSQQISAQGRHAEAEAELRAIWDIQRRPDVLGEEHPNTLITHLALATALRNQGRHAEADAEFRTIWEIQRRPDVLGEEHPVSLATHARIADTAASQGRYAEAEAEFRAIWEIQRRPEVLGEEHPDTLITRHNMAQQAGSQGRHAEAEAEFRAIWEIQRRPDVLGEHHPHTLTTRANLAQIVGNQGHHAEAEREYRAILEIQRRPEVLGEHHPHTLIARANIARLAGCQGRHAEAEAEFRAIWEIQRRPEVLGEEHPNNLRIRFRLAEVCDAQGKRDEASILLEDLDNQFARHVDESHSWRTELAEYLASRD